jgi:hypothetical protein
MYDYLTILFRIHITRTYPVFAQFAAVAASQDLVQKPLFSTRYYSYCISGGVHTHTHKTFWASITSRDTTKTSSSGVLLGVFSFSLTYFYFSTIFVRMGGDGSFLPSILLMRY